MCKWGTDVVTFVNIPKELSYTGAARWERKAIDSCLVGLVDALNDAGILTKQSCCGHGKGPGEILLQDGRILTISQQEGEDQCK